MHSFRPTLTQILGLLERWRKLVSRSTLKIFDYEHFRSESFSKRTSKGKASELKLLRGGLPSEITLQRGSLESKIVYQGVGADFEKPLIYFWLTMTG